MKKAILLAVVAVLALTVAAQASSVSFSWGANFLSFSNTYVKMSVGQATQLNWYADDFGFGVRSESTTLSGSNYAGYTANLSVTEILVEKWLSKSVAVGLGIGSGTVTDVGSLFGTDTTAPVIDVRGTVQLLSGKGEKINASLDFNLAARWMDTSYDLYDYQNSNSYSVKLDGTVASLAVTLGL